MEKEISSIINKLEAKRMVSEEAIEFAEWIRTFDSLKKEYGFWVIESQVSSEDLYKVFLLDRNRWRKEMNK